MSPSRSRRCAPAPPISSSARSLPERLLEALAANADRRKRRGRACAGVGEARAGARARAAGRRRAANSGPSLAVAAKAARNRLPILIIGEPGTGKETVARAIHAASLRAKGPLLSLDCKAIAANIIDSELFGHEKGAFPGAFAPKTGKLVEADGGTLLLDEIGALPADTQETARPRARDRRSPPGRPQRQPVGRRADHRDQQPCRCPTISMPASAERIGATTVILPPLRDRSSDIPALARHFLNRLADQTGLRPLSIGNDALAILIRYGWPGNVRQLASVLFRAALQCDGQSLTAEHFPHIAIQSRYSGRRTDFAPTLSEARSEEAIAGAPARHALHRRGPSAPARGDRSRHHPPRHRPLPRPHDRSRAPARDRPLDALPQARRPRESTPPPRRPTGVSAWSRMPRATTLSAWTVSNTSWTRRICAPCSAALSAKAMLPPSRLSAGASPDKAPIVRLRLAPTTIGQPSEWNSARPFISSRLWATFLPKPKPGSIRIRSRAMPGVLRGRDPLLEPQIDLDQHVVVARVVLHRLRRALVVHQHDRHRRGRDHAGRAVVVGQRRDVVDHSRAGLDRRRHDVGLARVDRHRRSAARKLADHRRDPLDLVAFPDDACAGPGRFAADVDDRRALARPCPRRPRRRPRHRRTGRRPRSCRA